MGDQRGRRRSPIPTRGFVQLETPLTFLQDVATRATTAASATPADAITPADVVNASRTASDNTGQCSSSPPPPWPARSSHFCPCSCWCSAFRRRRPSARHFAGEPPRGRRPSPQCPQKTHSHICWSPRVWGVPTRRYASQSPPAVSDPSYTPGHDPPVDMLLLSQIGN